MRESSVAVAVMVSCAACGGCKAGGAIPSPPPGVTIAALTVTSDSFPTNGAIPVDYTCDGADKAPQLTWSAPPPGTRSFAIIADDPDAPGGTFTHWVVFDIGPDVRALPEAAESASVGASNGANGFKRPGYGGPCPPKMELHRYYFRVFALDGPMNLKPGASREGLEAAMQGHVLAEGAVMGTFSH